MVKYIIFDEVYAVVFHRELTHAALYYRDTDKTSGPEGWFDIKRATSAGFVTIYHCEKEEKVKAHCFGESISLKLTSKEGDSKLVEAALGLF